MANEKTPSKGRRRPNRGSLPRLLRTARTLAVDAIRGYRLGLTGNKSASGAGIPVDAEERRAQIARMGASLGARMGAARVRTIGASDQRRREIYEASALRSAQDVLQVMGNMKGAVMKIAQMASFAFDGLPKPMQEQLKQLQSAAPPMTYDLAAEVVERELGVPVDRAFSEFDPVPIAAASIGQVHRAVTLEGAEVAVKVQYPGVDEAIKADLANADMLFTTMAAMFGGFDPRALLEEVVARLTEEFDYQREAGNQKWFADRYRGHPLVKVPDIVDDLSKTRIITSELIRGRRFYDVVKDSQDERNRYGEIIFRFAFGSIFVDGIFSGDPHPGNYIFMDDGRICFLDFGLVKRFEDDLEREQLGAVAKSMMAQNRSELMDAIREVGILPEGIDVDEERIWQFFKVIFGPIIFDEPFGYTRKGVSEAVMQVAAPDSDYTDVQIALQFPASLAIFQRYMLGTSAILGHLEAEANWHRIMKELFASHAPSTEIGSAW